MAGLCAKPSSTALGQQKPPHGPIRHKTLILSVALDLGMNLAPVSVRHLLGGRSVMNCLATRKMDGAYAFAPLSLALAQYLIEAAWCDLRATAKRIAARRREEAEAEGSPATASRRPMLSTADVPAAARERRSPPTDALSPTPKLGGSDAPHVWAAQFGPALIGDDEVGSARIEGSALCSAVYPEDESGGRAQLRRRQQRIRVRTTVQQKDGRPG